MATIRRLITAKQLIDNVPIAATTDQALLKKVIYNEQITKIQNMLGTKLYNAIVFEATENTIAGQRKELVDNYIKPALYQYSYRAAVLHLNLRMTDKGAILQSDTNGAQADAGQIKHLRADLLNKADFHADLGIKFICENEGSFPEYRNRDENGGIAGRKKGYFSGVQFK